MLLNLHVNQQLYHNQLKQEYGSTPFQVKECIAHKHRQKINRLSKHSVIDSKMFVVDYKSPLQQHPYQVEVKSPVNCFKYLDEFHNLEIYTCHELISNDFASTCGISDCRTLSTLGPPNSSSSTLCIVILLSHK